MASISGNDTTPKHLDKFAPESRFIELVEYDHKNQSMKMTFKNGTVKSYPNTSPSTFATFKQSPTHDAYFTKLIGRGKMISTTIVSGAIGRKDSTPLQKIKIPGALDNGIKRSRTNTDRIAGTVNRAFAAKPEL